ncbi:hypothetical protein FM107_04470 [Sphingobacterium sp. JB170]|nr:hypothetical protein FM107_04470 [Sphingobacterium sp. JB170]
MKTMPKEKMITFMITIVARISFLTAMIDIGDIMLVLV